MAKPWKIPNLNPDDNIKVCLQKILRTRFRETFSYENGTIEGSDIEALHNMRVSSRRLQAVLKNFQDCFSKRKFKLQYKKIRTLIRSLGKVRNYDVFIDTLEKYKQAVLSGDRKLIDLLIAHQKNLRFQERKILLQKFKSLENENYKVKFMEFITRSL